MCISGSLKKNIWFMNVERIYEQKRGNNKSTYKIVKFNSLQFNQVVDY